MSRRKPGLTSAQVKVLDCAQSKAVRVIAKEEAKAETRLQGAALDAVLVSLEAKGLVDSNGAATEAGRNELTRHYVMLGDEPAKARA